MKYALVVRFGNNIKTNCINEHKRVLEEYGKCWFGKLGRVPSSGLLKSVVDNNGKLLLYSAQESYWCDFTSISYERPNSYYPSYYDDLLYKEQKEPSIYFELTNIEDADMTSIEKYIVSSSGRNLTDTLRRSMNSFFLIEPKGKDTNLKVKEIHTKKHGCIVKNECKYRIDGVCGKKGFVSYQYECDRPSVCIGQKN